MSLADQLHQSKSITLDSSELEKIDFSKNAVSDLFAQGLEAFEKNITLYNESIDQKNYGTTVANRKQVSDEEI